MSTVRALPRQVQRLAKQRAASIHVRRIEHARGQFARAQRFADQIETACAVAEVEVQDAGFAGHHARDVTLGRDPQQLVERRLARSMIADRDLADADQRFDEHQVAAHAAGQRRGRHVIAARIAVRVQSFFAQRVERREQLAGAARDIVRAEQADDGRDACSREARQRHRRHASTEAGFAAAAGHVHVAIDESGNRATSGRIDDAGHCAQWDRQVERFVADPENASAADEQIADAERLRGVEVRVANQDERHGRVACGSLPEPSSHSRVPIRGSIHVDAPLVHSSTGHIERRSRSARARAAPARFSILVDIASARSIGRGRAAHAASLLRWKSCGRFSVGGRRRRHSRRHGVRRTSDRLLHPGKSRPSRHPRGRGARRGSRDRQGFAGDGRAMEPRCRLSLS